MLLKCRPYSIMQNIVISLVTKTVSVYQLIRPRTSLLTKVLSRQVHMRFPNIEGLFYVVIGHPS